MIRCIYRVVEYIQGKTGYIMSHEAFIYVFDASLMFIVMLLFNVMDPTRVTVRFHRLATTGILPKTCCRYVIQSNGCSEQQAWRFKHPELHQGFWKDNSDRISSFSRFVSMLLNSQHRLPSELLKNKLLNMSKERYFFTIPSSSALAVRLHNA